MKLRDRYNKTINEYITKFEELTELEFEYWIGNKIGEVAEFSGDYVFDFIEIKYAIDNNIDEDALMSYYHFNLEYHEARLEISAFCKLREDLKYKSGFSFSEDLLYLNLLYIRVRGLNMNAVDICK